MRAIQIAVAILALQSGGIADAQTCPPDQDWNVHPVFRGLISTPADFTAGGHRKATSLRFADLNGDGLEDAINAISIGESYVSILLSRGDGLFERRIAVRTSDGDSIETADAYPVDLDGDGDLDIATANARTDDTTMLFNDGNANFTRGPRYSLGDEPRSLVAGDLDGDGDQDLAFMNVLSQDVSILLNRGDGTFDPEIRIPVGGTTPRGNPNRTFPYPGPFLAIGDLDGDADLDIVVPGGFHAEILINDGSAGFTLADDPLPAPRTLHVYDIELRDLDGDGDLDIGAALHGGSSYLAVWLNNGDATFGEGSAYDTRAIGEGFLYNSASVALGDLDNDGDLDAAVGNEYWGAYALLRNNGDGTFAPLESQIIGEDPWLLEILDINGDGWADLVAIRTGLSLLVTHLNDAEGTPRGSKNAEIGDPDIDYSASDSADLDGDGDLDLALGILGNHPATIRVMENDGSGTFSETWRTFVGVLGFSDVEDVRFAHMNGDKWIDLVFSFDEEFSSGEDPGSIWVAFGLPGLQFDPPTRFGFDEVSPTGIAIADIDGDGDNDVIAHVKGLFFRDDPQTIDRRIAVLLNDGAGGLTVAQQVVTDNRRASWAFGTVAVEDLDGDGDLDVLGVSGSRLDPGLLVVLLNDGTGHLELDHTMVTTPNGFDLVAGDFDGDGDPDAALMHRGLEEELPYLTVYENDGDAGFTVSQTFVEWEIEVSKSLAVEDIDGDGWLDLICASVRSGPVIHLNDGTGDFSNKAWYAANSPTKGFAFGDFDLDGDTDIISPRRAGSDIAPIVMLENVMCRCAADLDRDGVLTVDDFFLFLDRYSLGTLAFCDVDRDGDCDAEDFFAYLDLFAAGC